ncbi:chymotrypsin-1-like [Venturia canescens]|uniref:chymotrypsin-1-like n=1 Tax=Venturia canescens TaxID=32260 RepID=UPI001C9CCDDE|nr:chymotrypsin-1-like [Venturia canescens]
MYLLGGLVVFSCFAATVLSAPRVVGGHEAPEHAYPYQVSLQRSERHFCSGSILNKRYVLTAAHCAEAVSYKETQIVVGTNHLNARPQVYAAEASIVHEKYVMFQDYDIALLKTTKDIEFNEHVQPIKIPDRDITDYSLTATFSGWGVLDADDTAAPNDLQEIFLKLYKYDYETEVLDRHVFTLNREGEGICFGDSGGPLVLNGAVIGIASYVVPCARGQPDAYTRVFSYKSWVESKIRTI